MRLPKLILLLAFAGIAHSSSHSQTPSLQSRVRDGMPALYQKWFLDVTESKLMPDGLIIREITLSKDASSVDVIDQMLQGGAVSFFDFPLFPLEYTAITNYGQAELVMIRNGRDKADTIKAIFLVSQFSTTYSVYLFPRGGDNDVDMMAGMLKLSDSNLMTLDLGGTQFGFRPGNLSGASVPQSLNKRQTLWNEHGLKGKVKETVTKKFELIVEQGEVKGSQPFSLSIERYDKAGLQVYAKEEEHSFYSEKTVTGSFAHRIINEFRSDQNISILTDFKVTGDKAIGDLSTGGKYLNSFEYQFSRGRIIKEKRINYLKEVETETNFEYGREGMVSSMHTTYLKQDMEELWRFKYLSFDDNGNWTERTIYRSSRPMYREVRAVFYW